MGYCTFWKFWAFQKQFTCDSLIGSPCIYDKHCVPDVNYCVYFRDLKLRFSPTIWYYTVLIYWTCEKLWCFVATVILCDDMRSVWPSRSLALLARLQTQRQVNPLGVCGLTTQYTPHTNISPMCLCVCVWIFHKSLGCCLSDNSMYMSLVSRKLIIISFQSIIKISWTGSMLIIALHPWW